MQEKLVIEQAVSGDKSALESLYKDNIASLYRFVRHKVESNEIAEDITSESFTRAYSALENFRGDSSFKSYLYTIARNLVIDHYKNRGKSIAIDIETIDRVANNGSDQHEGDSQDKNIMEVKIILEKLPSNYREVLEQRYLLKNTVAESALNLGISESNVKVLTHRALAKCKEILKK